MKKILFTGASGFLGYSFCKFFKNEYEIHGIYYRQKFDEKGIHWHRFNLLDSQDLFKFVSQINPDIVLHAAAISNPNYCEENPTLSHHINVYSSIELAEICQKLNIPLLFTSTDLVFNGNAAPYSENDFPHPINKYGAQKLEVEESLLSDFSVAHICRLPLLFGFGPDYSKNFMVDILNKLDKSETVKAFTDELRTPISNLTASKAIKKLLDFILINKNPNSRLWHLGGPQSLSRFELALLIADLFEKNKDLVIPLIRDEMPMSAARPENISLDSRLFSSTLNFEMPSLTKQIIELKSIRQ